MLELAEEPLDQIALAIEPLAEAWFPFAIGFGRNVGDRALGLDEVADAIGIIGFVREYDGALIETVEQMICRWPIMRLICCQAEPDREPLRVDDCVDFGREAAP